METKQLTAQSRAGAAGAIKKFLLCTSGAAAIVMAAATPVVLGGLAYGGEVAYWELTKRELQNATDSAALAAGTQVRSGENQTTIENAALKMAQASGYFGGTSSPDFIVQHPPTSAPTLVDGTDPNGDNAYVYVITKESLARRFTKFFSHTNSVTINGDAVAKVENGRPACILALHPTASGAISTGGSTNVALTGCDIAANSISPTAITSTGNGSNVAADCISAVGNVSINNTYSLLCPAPIVNAPITGDPYAYVAEPANAACTSNKNLNQFPNQGSGAQRCYSGSSGGVSVSGNTTLAPNTTYVFENTGGNTLSFSMNGNKTLSGTNVTLFFKGKWDIKTNGNSSINITAPTTGPYAGLAIWGSKNSEVDIDFTGNNGAFVVGAIYSPNNDSEIKYTGSNVTYSAGQCTQVIGGTVTFWGNSDFSTDCSSSGTTDIKTAQTIRIVG
ncbi:MAG: Tad domain-containing protein [Parvularculaceae bacterium]